MTIADLNKYKYGGLAGLLLSQKSDIKNIRHALEALRDSEDFDTGDADLAYTVAISNENTLKECAVQYANEYQESMKNTDFNDLKEHYNEKLQDFLGEDTPAYENAIAEFDRFYNEDDGNDNPSYGSKLTEYEKARLIKDNADLYSDNEVAEARATVRELRKIMTTIDLLESSKMYNLLPEIKDKTTRERLESMYVPVDAENIESHFEQYHPAAAA
jgi:hypothetical protein